MSARDRAVLEASKALEAANASGDAQRIRSAMADLEAALRSQAQGNAEAAAAAAPAQAAPENAAVATESAEAGAAAGGEEAAAPAAAPKPAPRPVVAVRGDDRPGMRKDVVAPAAAGRGARPDGRGKDAARGRARCGPPGGRSLRRGSGWPLRRSGRACGIPWPASGRCRLPRAARCAGAGAEHAAQAGGPGSWRSLDAGAVGLEPARPALLPSAQELGGQVNAATRTAWAQALSAPAAGDAAQSLLRLEMAAEVPTPAEHLSARRALQLQLLTRRNDPSPAQTWGQDAARVLAASSDEASAVACRTRSRR